MHVFQFAPLRKMFIKSIARDVRPHQPARDKHQHNGCGEMNLKARVARRLRMCRHGFQIVTDCDAIMFLSRVAKGNRRTFAVPVMMRSPGSFGSASGRLRREMIVSISMGSTDTTRGSVAAEIQSSNGRSSVMRFLRSSSSASQTDIMEIAKRRFEASES